MDGAAAVVAALRSAGVARLFGVPGGGSSLDLMAAAQAAGMAFHLARTETGAAIMAATTAELTGAPGAVLTTRGPGVAAAANGIAHASLDRAALIHLADGFSPAERGFVTHQFLDHAALMRPITKAQLGAGGRPGAVMAAALSVALTPPRGPVLVELTGADCRAPAEAPPAFTPPPPEPPDPVTLAEAQGLLAQARRPVIVAGMEARGAAGPLRSLAEALRCPVLLTYKAKGVLPDGHPLFAGIFTGGVAEAPLVGQADLILLAGADPVEWIPRPWAFTAPVIDLVEVPRHPHYLRAAVTVAGDVGLALAALSGAPGGWSEQEVTRAREAWRAAVANAPGGNRGISPQAVVELTQSACRAAGRRPRVAVDAGAHMFPCTCFWQAEAPQDLLISNGLSTMGFALPAGIAAALHDPERGAIAFTGDGGLLMCLGELATAAALGVRLTVVVFNDSALSLIDIKKGERILPPGALDWPMADLAAVARALGFSAWRAEEEGAFARAIAAALAEAGPALVDARVDPGSYARQMTALRG
ncbi:MAG: thiamine pyrophosphate-binding protein [Rhodovarius sp.]|nr:thiamine pyrophosphate-binding protein [Rhodovarius sp.]